MAKLVFVDPGHEGRAYEFVMERTTVGRSDQNALVIRDASVSSNHGEILVHGLRVVVRDLDSSNGTFVNGARVTKPTQILAGQVVRFGSVSARLELGPVPDDEEATGITAVYALRHLDHQQAQEQAQGPPGEPAPWMPLGPEPAPGATEQTILLPQTAPAPPAVPAAAPAGQRSRARGKGLAIVLGAAVLAILALVAWLVWGRK